MALDADRGTAKRPSSGERPAVSVVMPFAGDFAAARAAVETLLAIHRQPGDEIVVVDNTGAGAVGDTAGIRVVTADEERSAYYARNAGVEAAENDWLLFVDSDCRPQPDILGRYFEGPLGEDVGAVVGEVAGDPEQNELAARYSRSRGHLSQLMHWSSPYRPWGVTANLLVRREAWESIGGFLEGVRSGGDTEFSWRLQSAGWKLEYRPEAVVEHRHRDSVRKLVRVAARYGAGRAWLQRRYPDAVSHPRLVRELTRSVAGVIAFGLTGRFERASFKALDGAWVLSGRAANLLSNTPPGGLAGRAPSAVAAIANAFPASDDPATVARAAALGPGVPVEARMRPVRVDRAASRAFAIAWSEDDGALRRLSACVGLAVRRPLRVVRYSVHRTAAAPGLRELAPRAHRLAALGVRELAAVDDESRGDAEALAALLGVPLRQRTGVR
jgi:GT2 family glycosyltransferase